MPSTYSHVGLLLPQLADSKYSKIFHKSILERLNKDFQITIAFTASGELRKVINSTDQLINFHEVDIIVALGSFASISSSFDQLHKANIPLILANLGEQFIRKSDSKLPKGISVSPNFWKDAHALGIYAGEHFNSGIILGSSFELGFSFVDSFSEGFSKANKNGALVTIPTNEISFTEAEINKFKEYAKDNKVDFVFVLQNQHMSKQIQHLCSQEFEHLQLIYLPHVSYCIGKTSAHISTRQSNSIEQYFTDLGSVVADQLMNGLVQSTTNQRIMNPIEVTQLHGDQFKITRHIDSLPTNTTKSYDYTLEKDENFVVLTNSISSSWLNLYPFPS
jgi:hypothetical protein